ncbi:MAG TPA: hypothetical protein PLO43_02330, partial [Chlamydiales bacterium]|nr:hypothetical protein [Chlamydiales bacterium]
MAIASTKSINGTSPVPGLAPSEYERIHRITRAVDENLNFKPDFLQRLGPCDLTKLLDPKSNPDPTCQKISRQTVFLIKKMLNPESQPHINLISYHWLTILQNQVNIDQIDGKDDIIAELEEKKANLTPMPTDGFNLIIKPQTSKTFTPTETLQRLAGLCAKEPSPSNLYGFWTELRPTFLSCFSFHIETEMEALQILNTHYGTWTFTKFYEILCFRRDIFLYTPPHAAKQAAAAEHLWRCFKNLIDDLSEDSLDAFTVAWWYFAICEIDHPPLLPAACALTADLKLDLSHIHISKDTQALQQELRYLSFKMDGFRSQNFKYSDDPKTNLDAHVVVVTHFFEISLFHIESQYPNIDLIETSALKNLVVGYFIYYGIYQNVQEDSLIKPILNVPPTYLKLLAAKLENHLLLLQTLPSEHLEEVFTLSILEYLHTLLELLSYVPDDAKEEPIKENQSHVDKALETIYEGLKQTTNFNDRVDLSKILRISFGMSSISTTDPIIAKFAHSFAQDITPFLEGSGPYAKIDPAILSTARQLAGSIASKDRADITRDDLRQLVLLWIEG